MFVFGTGTTKPSTYLPALSIVLSSRSCGFVRSARVGVFQTRDVELRHLHHGLHDPLRSLRVLVLQHVDENGRYDLPRQAKLVLEPAALTRRSAISRELLPIGFDLVLRLAVDDQGHGLVELERGAAVQGRE